MPRDKLISITEFNRLIGEKIQSTIRDLQLYSQDERIKRVIYFLTNFNMKTSIYAFNFNSQSSR